MKAPDRSERSTQLGVIKLFRNQLGYEYLEGANAASAAAQGTARNISEELLTKFLGRQGHAPKLIAQAVQRLHRAASNQTQPLYDSNREVYELLRNGARVRLSAGQRHATVWLIDWKHPENNHFAIAEEVAVPAATKGSFGKRPDIVLYVNGIALGVLELKRSTVPVSEAIRQCLDNQKQVFIKPFFSTIQILMAGNATEGLRYGVIETPEKEWLTWKEDSDIQEPLMKAITQICHPSRFLELIHDFIVYDAGKKKICRHNQYFGVKTAQAYIRRRDPGIIWHTQGSGKSLTMVWLARWIRENYPDGRVLIVTDRQELDEQIVRVFQGVDQQIVKSQSCRDLLRLLSETAPWLLCSLIHKFSSGQTSTVDDFLRELSNENLAKFTAQGDIIVFVDECHRTQSGKLHRAMKRILPNALFLGFTGTPLLKATKTTTLEVFGPYIHTYKFDEAVADGAVLDLKYEARDIDQSITSTEKIDKWFDAKTRGLNDIARAKLKQRWGTLQKVLSCKSRLEVLVSDIILDMETRDRLKSGMGNALLVTSSIYEACSIYELLEKTDLANKCAIITSYRPVAADLKGEESGEGQTERIRQYEIYNRMLNGMDPDAFEATAKKRFVEHPGQMKLLIVVDKLLTGFDAPPATYLYIDKQMRDHNLFQAICRLNRIHSPDKEYGYVIDYKDLFRSLENSVHDYTSASFDGFAQEDISGLLSARIISSRRRLDDALEAVKALCAPVAPPYGTQQYLSYFCPSSTDQDDTTAEQAVMRKTLYRSVTQLIRAYAEIANDMEEAGYSNTEAREIRKQTSHYEDVRSEVKLASGDHIELKMYEPAMRHLIDTYIRADESKTLTVFDDMSLIDLIVSRGSDALDLLPARIRNVPASVAETIENNVRKLIIDEMPVNPKYYENMSILLEELVEMRRTEAISYSKYINEIVELTKQAKERTNNSLYPVAINSPVRRTLYDNLDGNESLAIEIDIAIQSVKKESWRGHVVKEREVRKAISEHVADEDLQVRIYDLVWHQDEY